MSREWKAQLEKLAAVQLPNFHRQARFLDSGRRSVREASGSNPAIASREG